MKPVVSTEQMRNSDRTAISGGTSGRELMYRAASGIFRSFSFSGHRVAIVSGSGNNAGDGYALASILSDHNVFCTLFRLTDRFSEDGFAYFEECVKKGVPDRPCKGTPDFGDFDVIVDCIFGTGFSGTPDADTIAVIEAINRSNATVISADINSGQNGDSGLAVCAVRSDLTVSIGTTKYGHYLGDAKDLIGSLCNVDIGIPIVGKTAYLAEDADFDDLLCPRRNNAHKGTYGYVTIVGGCREYTGAVKLANAACSALRSGCGVVRLAVADSTVPLLAPALLESTLLPLPDQSGAMRYSEQCVHAILSHQAAVAVGCGWGSGSDNERILQGLLHHAEAPLLIDADGLNALARIGIESLRGTRAKVILTPHCKEFERISGIPIETILQDPVSHTRAFAKKTGTIVLLKGPCTVVSDGEEVFLVNRGCAGMATAGSGDVLTGILTGLLGYHPASARVVACAAFLAGTAGELAEKEVGSISLIASDTVSKIPEAIRRITGKP